MKPTISVIIPLHNKETYIKETIESVVKQTFQNWELVIVDNCSSDNSALIAKEYISTKIHFFECLRKGPSAARNFGLRYAKGDWILFLDADDLLRPKYFEYQLNTARSNPDAKIIASCWSVFSEDDLNTLSIKEPAGFSSHNQNLIDTAIAFTPWAPHAAIICRQILSSEYSWPEDLDQYLAEDTAFWFRLIYDFKVAYNCSSEALYRANTPNSRTNFDPQRWFEGLHHAVLKNLEFIHTRKILITFAQCEYLTRLYSEIYQLAYKRKDIDIMNMSFAEAKYWLNCYFHENSKPKFSMIIRKVLGLKLFLKFI